VWPRAREAAAQAIRAEPDLAEAQHALGQVSWWLEWDWPTAETAFRRAVALDASNAWAHSMLGHLLSQGGRHDEASSFMRRARELEPLSSLHDAMSSQVAFQARDYSTAVEQARQAIIIDPEFWVGYMMRGQAYEQLGETDLALEALVIGARLSGGQQQTHLAEGLSPREAEEGEGGARRAGTVGRHFAQPIRAALRDGARARRLW
jgi:Flp pilus assembly protein TadD